MRSVIKYGKEASIGHKTKIHKGLYIECDAPCYHCFMCDEPKKTLYKLRQKMIRKTK